jgi:hypothetical protein
MRRVPPHAGDYERFAVFRRRSPIAAAKAIRVPATPGLPCEDTLQPPAVPELWFAAEVPLPGPGSPSRTPELLPEEPEDEPELELAPLLVEPLLPELLLDEAPPDPLPLLPCPPLALPLLLPLTPASVKEVLASPEPLELPETPPSSP